MPGQITMAYEEFQPYVDAAKKHEDVCAALRQEIIDAKLGDPGSHVRSMATLTRAAIQVARFAMANMSPEAIKGWPFDELRIMSDMMPLMPDHTSDDNELAMEMRTFADEAERWERRRKLEGK